MQQEFTYEQEYPVESKISILAAFGSGGLPGEPPLLEELGINFEHVKTKTVTVLNPFKTIDTHMMDDADLVGPLFFCLLLGFSTIFLGKVQFGYIYGVAMLGWISMYGILNLMSEQGVDLIRTASVLGYCLLPIVFLGLIGLVLDLNSIIGAFLAPVIITWATYAASTIFVTVLHMQNQRLLVAYPIALLYTCFSLITIF
ncbi:Yip1-domain-containing protein [Neoconidiobolus thromboides FSU 785]|nr:Yip1-domain-containing protein [Neoconidiobolus thromboides FSU 785]